MIVEENALFETPNWGCYPHWIAEHLVYGVCVCAMLLDSWTVGQLVLCYAIGQLDSWWWMRRHAGVKDEGSTRMVEVGQLWEDEPGDDSLS